MTDLADLLWSTERAEQELLPLLLFKGYWSLGRAQGLWNYAQVLKDRDVPSSAEWQRFGQAEDEIVHACGFHVPVQADSIVRLTRRINSAPELRRLDPGLHEYLMTVCRRSRRVVGTYRTLDRYSPRIRRSERLWRQAPKQPRVCPSCATEFMPFGPQRYCSPKCRPRPTTGGVLRDVEIGTSWPFIARADPIPLDGLDTLTAIDRLVPLGLPEQVRQDVCQDIVLAVLEGEISLANLQDEVNAYVRSVFKRFPIKYGPLSLDAPPPWDSQGRTLGETLAAV